MRAGYFIIQSAIAFALFACSYSPQQAHFNVNPEVVLKNFTTWWNYNYHNINLTEDYTPLDTSSKVMDKVDFLKCLSSGDYVAFKLSTTDSSLKYELHKLGTKADNDIKATVKQLGKNGYQRYKMEGTVIPDFNFIDLNGKVYNPETTKGKLVILKCWFIHCQVCVEEIPALNEVVQQYKNRNDVVFISLAFDTKTALQTFLKKTKFEYAVIPVQQAYLENRLGVIEYPTQFIIDRTGKIVKAVTDYQDMIAVLKHTLLQ